MPSSMSFVVTTGDRVVAVREALEKIHSQGQIGTVNLERCIAYLKEVEASMERRSDAVREFKRVILGLDD